MMKRKEFSGRQLEVHNLSSNVPCTLALLATEIHPWKNAWVREATTMSKASARSISF